MILWMNLRVKEESCVRVSGEVGTKVSLAAVRGQIYISWIWSRWTSGKLLSPVRKYCKMLISWGWKPWSFKVWSILGWCTDRKDFFTLANMAPNTLPAFQFVSIHEIKCIKASWLEVPGLASAKKKHGHRHTRDFSTHISSQNLLMYSDLLQRHNNQTQPSHYQQYPVMPLCSSRIKIWKC